MTNIIDDLAGLAVDTAGLDLYPGNPRQGDVDAIARSLELFGQRKPIVITEAGTVVAGNHTLLAARALGWDQIAAVRVPDDPTQAQAYLLADNRTAELATYDPVALAQLLQSVQAEDEALLAAISYSTDDIDDLLAAVEEAAPLLIEHVKPDAKYGGTDEGSYVHPDNDEQLAGYQVRGIRSILLEYPLDEYQDVVDRAAALRSKWEIDNNAELFTELLRRAS